jgi:hypothetical protein
MTTKKTKKLEPQVESCEKPEGVLSLVTAMSPKDEFWNILKQAGFPEIGKTMSWTIRDDGKNIVIKSSCLSPHALPEEEELDPDFETDC